MNAETILPLDETILGQGVYTPREAARLIGTSAVQVLRWTRGSGPHAPLWDAHYQFIDEGLTEISFLDLVEVRVVAALRRVGVSLQAIRFAISYASEKYSIERPLASQAFQTDGTEILMDAVERDGELVSLSKKRPGQKVFRQIISQSLSDLEYEGDRVARWRPRNHEAIIIDPQRHFGDPLIDEFGISTRILYREYAEFEDVGYLASIYEVPPKAIWSGLKFEKSLDRLNDEGSS